MKQTIKITMTILLATAIGIAKSYSKPLPVWVNAKGSGVIGISQPMNDINLARRQAIATAAAVYAMQRGGMNTQMLFKTSNSQIARNSMTTKETGNTEYVSIAFSPDST